MILTARLYMFLVDFGMCMLTCGHDTWWLKTKMEINKKEVGHVGTMSPAFNALRKEESRESFWGLCKLLSAVAYNIGRKMLGGNSHRMWALIESFITKIGTKNE